MKIFNKKTTPCKIVLGLLVIALIFAIPACGGGGSGGGGDTESADTSDNDGSSDDSSFDDGSDDSSSDDSSDSSGSTSDSGTTITTGGFSSSGCGTPTGFSKKVEVLGLCVFATSTVSDDKVLHAAKVLGEYLDNNEDGAADDADLLAKMVERKAYMVMFADQTEQDSFTGEQTSYCDT